MEKKVTVLTPNGRRQNVKITPNTTLLQILEEACQKHGFDSDDYGLKHHNKEMDLTQMFRFSGLPNNCLLEMSQLEKKRIASNVDICIQLEDGSRKQGQFAPTVDLWAVLENLCADEAQSYPNPVAIYMRRELIGKDAISGTTLKFLGITEGRALIRFINKTADELKTQANVYKAPEPKPVAKEDETQSKPRSDAKPAGGGGGGFAITKDIVDSLKKNSPGSTENMQPMQQDSNSAEPVKFDWGSSSGHTMQEKKSETANQMHSDMEDDEEPEPEINIIGERHAIIYSLDCVQKHMEDLPDSFFDLTVHDLKLVLRDLKKVSAGNADVPLLTEKLRQLEEDKNMLNKLAKFKNCIIRIQFPDRYVLQGIFKPVEKVADVISFVRKFLIDPNVDYHLFVIPPKTILPLEKTLLEMDFVPNALLHFGVNDETANAVQAYLKSELLEKLTSPEGALYAATKFRYLNDDSCNNPCERFCLFNKSELSGKPSPQLNRKTAEFPTAYESKPPGPSTGAIPKRRRD